MKAAAPHFLTTSQPWQIMRREKEHHERLTLLTHTHTPDTRRRFNPTVRQTSGGRGYNTTRFYGFPGERKARQYDMKRQEARSARQRRNAAVITNRFVQVEEALGDSRQRCFLVSRQRGFTRCPKPEGCKLATKSLPHPSYFKESRHSCDGIMRIRRRGT